MSTFSSLNTALSALHFNRIALDVHGGNVANVGTDGYARRRVVGESVGAPAVPAIWSKYDGAGDGVRVGSLDRMVDPLLDVRARTEHAQQSLLDGQAEVLLRLETGIGEPGPDGVNAALSAYWSGWHDVANNPGDGAARSQLLARANALTGALGSQARLVTTEWSDQAAKLTAVATEADTLATEVAALNGTIQQARLSGTDPGTLEDRRDQLVLRLAELTGATTTTAADGTYTVTVGGQNLVAGTTAADFTATAGSALGDPVQVRVGGTDVTANVGAGTVGAIKALLQPNGTLHTYAQRLDSFAASLATSVNAQHDDGFDLTGAAGGAFFTGTTAATIRVAITDPSRVAASSVTGTLGNANATAMTLLASGDQAYRQLVTEFGAQVASAGRLADNQRVMTTQVDGAREALSGISLDEEMVAMVTHQRAYEAASRLMTTLDSVLDTLINRTGLVR
jgi:flagellar hook-associated protein 1